MEPDKSPRRQRLDELLEALLPEREAEICEQNDYASPFTPPCESICVVGGGTSGFLSALALHRAFPELPVTLIESSKIPIIGVGEATVDTFPAFLHRGLGLDIVKLYQEVRPTWKLGIRFEWGAPADNHFDAPFNWQQRGLGFLSSLHYENTINWMNLQTVLMGRDLSPLLVPGEGEAPFGLSSFRFAYHLDNRPFVEFLKECALAAGIRYVDATLLDAELSEDGTEVRALRTAEGERLEFDFFVDCSGFRSFLLEKKLGVGFQSFASSLFTDRALAFEAPHQGKIKPYTTAKTMDAGWCWIIPQEENDHCGYVFSSAFLDEAGAREEIRRVFPGSTEPRLVRFQSGRHDKVWVGNVFAVGNAYGFVEPLESTGILMIQRHVEHLVSALRVGQVTPELREAVNQSLGNRWDALRWFLAVHFRFNRNRDTAYWKAARAETDVHKIQPLLDSFAAGAPLVLRNPRDLETLETYTRIFYGLEGYDCLLLGQEVPTRLLPPLETREQWEAKKRQAEELVSYAVPLAQALKTLRENPELLRQHAQSFHYSL